MQRSMIFAFIVFFKTTFEKRSFSRNSKMSFQQHNYKFRKRVNLALRTWPWRQIGSGRRKISSLNYYLSCPRRFGETALDQKWSLIKLAPNNLAYSTRDVKTELKQRERRASELIRRYIINKNQQCASKLLWREPDLTKHNETLVEFWPQILKTSHYLIIKSSPTSFCSIDTKNVFNCDVKPTKGVKSVEIHEIGTRMG